MTARSERERFSLILHPILSIKLHNWRENEGQITRSNPPSIHRERAGDEALNRLSPLERLAALAGDSVRQSCSMFSSTAAVHRKEVVAGDNEGK